MDNLFDLTFPASVLELEHKLQAMQHQAQQGLPSRALPLLNFCILSTFSLLRDHLGQRPQERLLSLTKRWMEASQSLTISGEITPALPDDVIEDLAYLVSLLERNKHQITAQDFNASTNLMRKALEMTNQTLVDQISKNYTDALKEFHA